MTDTLHQRVSSRRQLLKAGGWMAGAGMLAGLLPKDAVAAAFGSPAHGEFAGARAATPSQSSTQSSAQGQSAAAAPVDRVAQMRTQAGTTPLKSMKLRDNIFMLYGPGGNMVVLTGADGKVLVDSSYSTVVPKIREALDAMGGPPLKVLINTHWHIDHTDGNQALHDAGALIVAHENTRKRLAAPQFMAAFGLHFDPAPAAAWPQQTFTDRTALYFDNEQMHLGYFSPAHTDSDIYVHYQNGNVLHMGDIWFNGTYPLIDASTGGNINGMVAASAKGIEMADADTKIVPGHGALADKAGLTKYHDMLATVRDRVKKAKDAGKSAEEVTAAKPTADLDAQWGTGFIKGDTFVNFVYSTL
jgi:cyclase